MAVTRFAPSPTGHLHLGHVFSAHIAAALGDGYVLRIDDIDHTRCRPEYTQQIFHDLRWLGLPWTGPVQFQSDRLVAYDEALQRLKETGLVYPCFLKRAEINEILSAPQRGAETTNTPFAPPSTFGALSQQEIDHRISSGALPAWRLHSNKAIKMFGAVAWQDAATGQAIASNLDMFGDVILARKDIGTSYHLSVVIDDALDNVSLVTRGADLQPSTHIHRVLQAALNLPSPAYFHHELIVDESGRRLAKRDQAKSITFLRESGATPIEIIESLPKIPNISAL